MKTYIAMNGSIGCIPDNSELHSSFKAACDSLINLFGIKGTHYAGELRRDGITYFAGREHEFGADYCEVAGGDEMTRKEYEKACEEWI